jgi:hypothetical protein
VKIFLLVCCAAAAVVAGVVWDKIWVAGLGLAIGFSAMWLDRGDVRLEGEDHYTENSMEVRKMRTKRKQP